MKTALRNVAAFLFFAVVLAGALALHTWYERPLVFSWFLDRMLLQQALESPETLSQLRVLEPWGIRAHNAKLDDASPAAALRQVELARRNLETLVKYDRASLSAADQVTYDVAHWNLKVAVDGGRFAFHSFQVNPSFGVQGEIPTFLAIKHVVGDERDARDYLARLNLVGVKIDQVIESAKAREDRNLLPPKFSVDKVLEQMRGFIKPAPAENLLVTSFRDRLGKAKGVDAAHIDTFVADATRAVETVVYPAYGRLIAHFETLQARDLVDEGVWRQPEGDAYYAWATRHFTTTELTPQQVHEIGLAEVQRLEAEMDAILRAQGYTAGTVGARLRALGAEPRFNYPDTDDAKRQVLVDYQVIIDEIDAGLGPAFHLRPRSKVRVERVPPFKERTAPGAYYEAPPLDGSRPGTFWLNLRNIAEIQKFGMRTLAYHEAVPGHHFQVALAREMEDLHLYRKLGHYTAFIEGWALYAERLAWELGYQKDPFDDLGRLQGEMLRAVRLVVDTGMHYKRWTREEGIRYMAEKTGSPETDVVAEIDRYLVWPGQALGYKIGQLEILKMRDDARTKLGEKFTLPEFHDAVLGGGAIPLSALRNRIDAWVSQKSSS
ncbi:MAG TPA: DUF885 domain-containing protein [Nevskiaceae bacterium]|nr:DUF885 domain-containing protein [Nevskiaceae bacterium]